MKNQIVSVYKKSDQKLTRNRMPFWVIETDKGEMSIWDEDIADGIEEGFKYNLDYELSKGKTGKRYINVLAHNGVIEELTLTEKKQAPVIEKNITPFRRATGFTAFERADQINENVDKKNALVCISYAKDLAVADKIKIDQIPYYAEVFWNSVDRLINLEKGEEDAAD